jgi:hypothetical protein
MLPRGSEKSSRGSSARISYTARTLRHPKKSWPDLVPQLTVIELDKGKGTLRGKRATG